MGRHEGVTVIDFAPAEWATLRFAPFWVLAAIAGRQRGFDRVEFDVFSEVVEEASVRARGRFGGDVLHRVALDLDRLAAAFGDDQRSVVTGLFEVCRLLERLPPDEAEVFREALVRGVAEGMARARGATGGSSARRTSAPWSWWGCSCPEACRRRAPGRPPWRVRAGHRAVGLRGARTRCSSGPAGTRA